MTDNNPKDTSEIYHIAIIGMGPKGLYGLERLMAQIKNLKLKHRIQIHVFNRTGFFGAGDIYRCDQPSYLIMNYANRNIDMWSTETPRGVVSCMMNFSRWLSKKSGIPQNKLDSGFAPRAMVGNYLMDGFTQLCEKAPKNVSIIPHIAIVEDIKEQEGKFMIETKLKCSNLPRYVRNILLTTGHSWHGAKFNTVESSATHIDFIYPIDKNLNGVLAGSKVAIKGLGLTFIDAVLALTQGRGGIFKKTSQGTYSYFASGNEPDYIYPFSRTGIPMIPRNGDAESRLRPYFLTEEVLGESEFVSLVHFENAILPLIKKEFLFDYYRVLFKNRNRELLYNADFSAVQTQINNFHKAFPEAPMFDWEAIENPFASTNRPTHEEFLDYSTFVLAEAEKGQDESSLMAAVSSWRKISPLFNRIYSYGGLDAASHQLFDNYYFGFFNRISYGPPLENMKKILALAEYGILDFTFVKNPQVKQIEQPKGFRLGYFNEQKAVTVDYLIDARIPRGNCEKKVSELFSNLLKKGTIQRFVNECNSSYSTAGVDIDLKGRPFNSDGNVNRNLTFYGTPTEGVTFDNDTLSRQRNNFASQWAFDVCVDIEKIQENIKDLNEEESKLHTR